LRMATCFGCSYSHLQAGLQ